jgi:hypothetical protein
MKTSINFPHEFRIPASQDHTRSIKDPYQIRGLESESISTIHSLVRVRDFPSGLIPDQINPRSHEEISMKAKVPSAITKSLLEDPEHFHLLNRGCLIVAKDAWYDNQTRLLHFVIESEDDHGMVDGATTDRVIGRLKGQVSKADFHSLKENEIPDYFNRAFMHVEIISGDIDQDLRINLADARNTSLQVKEFSLEDLGGGFDWLKKIIENSQFHGKVRFRENEPKPVDVRTVLALLTLFHPRWLKLDRDPIIAYSAKGTVLDIYKDKKEIEGYERLSPVVIDILKLFEYIQLKFQNAYKTAYGINGAKAKLGRRTEVKHIDNLSRGKILAFSGEKLQNVIADGWIYPLLGSLRMLLIWPKNTNEPVKWITDPFKFFDENGHSLVYPLVERSGELGRNPNATGKSKGVWIELRGIVENKVLKERLKEFESN